MSAEHQVTFGHQGPWLGLRCVPLNVHILTLQLLFAVMSFMAGCCKLFRNLHNHGSILVMENRLRGYRAAIFYCETNFSKGQILQG